MWDQDKGTNWPNKVSLRFWAWQVKCENAQADDLNRFGYNSIHSFKGYDMIFNQEKNAFDVLFDDNSNANYLSSYEFNLKRNNAYKMQFLYHC